MTNKLIALAIILSAIILASIFRYDYSGVYGTRIDRWTGKLHVVCITKEGNPWMTVKECAGR